MSKINFGRIKQAVVRLAFKILSKEVLSKISFEPLRAMLQGHHNLYADVVNVLTDKDPNNSEQLAQVWEVHKNKFIDNSFEALAAGIRVKVKDTELAESIIDALAEIIDEVDDAEMPKEVLV